MNRSNDADFVRRKAWSIAMESGWYETIAQFLDISTAYSKIGKHVPSPFSDGGRDGFKLYKDFDQTGGGVDNSFGNFKNGIQMIAKAIEGSEHDACLQIIQAYEGTNPAPYVPKKVVKKPVEDEMTFDEKVAFLNQVFSSSYFNANGFFQYMLSRGVHVPMEYMPHNIYWNDAIPISHRKDVKKTFPGLVCSITNSSGVVVGAHRILTQDGKKAPLEKSKLLMPSPSGINGSLIRGYPVFNQTNPLFLTGVRGFTEGVEDMACCTMATKVPCAAGISSTILMNADFEDSFDVGIIFADDDEAGYKAAYSLSVKLMSEGKKAIVLFPSHEGMDWNDMMAEYGSSVFPKVEPLIRRMRSTKYKINVRHPTKPYVNWGFLKEAFDKKS